MDWIKKNPHLAALAALALLLIISSGVVLQNVRALPSNFSAVQAQVPHNNHLNEMDLKPIEVAEEKLQRPAKWVGESLFVPDRYVVDAATHLPQRATAVSFYTDSLTKQPIPNQWFIDNHLPLTDPKVQFSDPDGDGFPTEDEWRGVGPVPGAHSTDPNDKTSHPPYYSKLFLKQFIRVPFRLLFQAYDGDPKKPEEMTFQINAIDRGKRTEFLKLNEKVLNSPYLLKSFAFKTRMNEKTQEEQDVSELTVQNTETKVEVILPLTRVTDSPDSYALFIYEWPQPMQPIRVKKLGTFPLPPDPAEKVYTLLDINENTAKIKTPSGEEVTISRDPRQ